MGMAMTKAGRTRLALGSAALTVLGGCMWAPGDLDVTKLRFGRGQSPAEMTLPALAQAGQSSLLIADLQARRSILGAPGPYDEVARAVTEAGAGVAAAELRVARLRAEAASKNWLPRIGPNVSLTSLGALAASLIAEQALFDNGRRKAERAYAAADVEVAAITLSEEANKRVYEGLKHYLNAERAREQMAVGARAVQRLAEYERIMTLRVDGGLSDRSEQRVLSQKLAEMHATLASDARTQSTAMAELSAMTTRPLQSLTGIQTLATDTPTAEPLRVLRARAEGARAVAQANAAMADMLPGLTASATLGQGGVEGGVNAGGGGFGFGNSATRQALAASGDLAAKRTAQAAEDANRRILALQNEIQTLQSREAQGAEVLRQTGGNLSMFTEQYRVGRRSLLELVQQYEGFARAERDQVALKYLAADLRLQIAMERGVLMDGSRL